VHVTVDENVYTNELATHVNNLLAADTLQAISSARPSEGMPTAWTLPCADSSPGNHAGNEHGALLLDDLNALLADDVLAARKTSTTARSRRRRRAGDRDGAATRLPHVGIGQYSRCAAGYT
jgi:hypothetical protein